MAGDGMKCPGCGGDRVDGDIDYFCPNKGCDYDKKQVKAIVKQMRISELRQKIPDMIAELARLEGK